jgi:ATP-binding cassette, subfamily B, bacterial
MAQDTDRPNAASLAPLKLLLPFLRPYRLRILGAGLAMILASAAMLILPITFRQVLDFGLAANQAATINAYFAGFLAAAVAMGIFAAARFYQVTWIGERVVADIRRAVFERIIHMDPVFFEVTRTGEVLSRLGTDTTLVQSITGSSLSIALRSTIGLIGALVMLTLTSPKLTGALAATLPLVVIPVIFSGRKVRGLSKTAQDKVADSSAQAQETFNSIQTVQAYRLEPEQIARFNTSVEHSFNAGLHRTSARARLTAVGTMLVFGALTLVLWLGAHEVLAGHMSGGALGQFVLYAIYVGSSSAMLTETFGELQRGAGALMRLSELLAATPTISAPANPRVLPSRIQGNITLHNLSFHYPSRPHQRAIEQFNLKIRAGETLALVGPSGAGKSTLFQLMLRFYDPQQGDISVDGVNIKEVDPKALREQIGLVPQDTVLFGVSAYENIRFGRLTATRAEITAAARSAAALEFIEGLPQGFDTYLGEKGMRLSGGQRQRIAIARAILKNPPILLLDEATSALDAESEQLIQTAIDGLLHERTTIIIAHRLSTVLKADRIIVIDSGKIVGEGTHSELLASNPLYAKLAAIQFAAAAEGHRHAE